jgi:hypothetical protein
LRVLLSKILFGKGRRHLASPSRCSFCGAAEDRVRKLIAGPAVHICADCVEMCNDILAESGETTASPPPVPAAVGGAGAGSVLAREVVFCSLCRLPAPRADGVVVVPDRGVLCRPCHDAVHLASWRPDGGP